ncbi:gap junction gamma-3 protein-like isoform X2 [Saccopteryx bilineata]|uniref:gap junction gamma-3 protein-like isoform X2 n=1 Tax=Saccopteryx bilineata TaxID=59482 RepID=UPI00338E2D63
MCGRFLRWLMAEESRYSTPVGRLLLPVLLGFRLVLLAAGGKGVYNDEQSEFVCHTQQPGCKAACYDALHALSPLRFWAFQVMLVAVPSALYMGFTIYHGILHWEEPGKLVLLSIVRWWRTWKQKSSFSNCFSTSERTRKHKEPNDNFPVVESKEQFREAEL